MGWGDEIMVTAQARRLQERDPRRVVVRSRKGLARWHPIWDGNPRLVPPGEFEGRVPAETDAIQVLDNFPGRRPYLAYGKFNNRDRSQALVFRSDFRVEPGEIYLTEDEKKLAELARDRIVLEPNIKPGASPNKDWGFERWEALKRELWGERLIQIGAPGVRTLEGVRFIPTRDVREAAAVLAGAELLIAPEGGLHHAAAALGVPAVVIFGGFISPATTGYESHRNLFTGGHACGMRIPCSHCRRAMAEIRPLEVAAAARELLRERAAA
jgi:ADP-heptose:LPS heptosyltransferase